MVGNDTDAPQSSSKREYTSSGHLVTEHVPSAVTGRGRSTTREPDDRHSDRERDGVLHFEGSYLQALSLPACFANSSAPVMWSIAPSSFSSRFLSSAFIGAAE